MKKTTFTAWLRIAALPAFLFLCLGARSQKIDSTLAVYADQYTQERTYLQYDKSSYYAGETIWFKAYLMEGIAPAEDSKTFYVDWVDDNGTVLSHTVAPIVESSSSGQFDIPSTYTGNFIHVKAYTKRMLNFDTAFLYTKDIRILSKNPKTTLVAKVAVIPSLQFFPEGGDAVVGVNNKIAFKATDQWGKPVRVKGVIVSNTNTVVDSLRTLHDGMGYFYVIPQPDATYTAKWTDEKGAAHTTPLPAIKPSGISLQVSTGGKKRYFTINRTADAADNLKTLHLVGTLHEHFVFKANVNLTVNTTASGGIPIESLPTGVLTMTVFDDNWNAVAERITYVNNKEYAFPTTLTVQHWGLSKRARNEIQITVPDSVRANLSVSVTDASIERDSSDNIISHLLLTGDLKGRVYNPAYYFSTNNDSASQYLDLVMLTNGWRRFKWEDVVKGKVPVITYPKDTSYLSLSGKVMGISQSQLRDGGSLVMIIKQKDTTSKVLLEPIGSNGTFNDPDIIFFDTLHVYYQFQKSKALTGAEVRFMNNRLPALNYSLASKSFLPLNPAMDTTGAYRHYLLAQEAAHALELMQGKVLQTVTVQAKAKSPLTVLDEKYTSGLFKGMDSYQFDLVNDVAAASYPNIFTYLQGRVAGLQINPNGAEVSMQWRGGTPKLYLDEIPADADMISGVPVSDIAYIKVFRPGDITGGSGGSIAIYTRKGGDVQPTPGKGLSGNMVMGYTPIKQFYSPNYASFEPRNDQRDVRSTLYWNPLIITSQKHTITLTFYNNDVSESFRVVVEGISKDGQLTHLEQVME